MMSLDRIPSGQRRQMIAEAAYFRAERRGFRDGDPVQDWIEAEKEVEQQLATLDRDKAHERFEERLAWVNDRFEALKRKALRARAEARETLERDLRKLAAFRAEFESQVEEVKRRGTDAGHKSVQRAEKLWEEVSAFVERVGPRRRPRT